MSQLPLDVGQSNYNPQFPYDFHMPLEPSVNIFGAIDGMHLAWPYGNTGFIVQSTTNLAASASWSDMTNVAAAITGKTYEVTLPPTGADRTFYRLRHPQ
jgi:hypothetical protein